MQPSINKLQEILDALRLCKQSSEREIEVFRLEQHIKILKNEREIKICETSLDLFNNYLKYGSMSVMLVDGSRVDGCPKLTGNPLQDVWNIRCETLKLSNLKHNQGDYQNE